MQCKGWRWWGGAEGPESRRWGHLRIKFADCREREGERHGVRTPHLVASDCHLPVLGPPTIPTSAEPKFQSQTKPTPFPTSLKTNYQRGRQIGSQ